MLPTPRIRRAALAAGLALAALPAAASADSIVYVKDADVWLANGDGTGQYQVTRDGTADQPYRVPVQADDGTIVASHRDEIVRMRQNGSVIGTIDPEPLSNSVSHLVDGPPVNLAVSPDGTRIGYSLVGYECPVGADCMARSVTAFTAADGLTPAGQWGALYRSNPSFVTDTRSLVFGGYGGQVNVHDLGDQAETHWFDDDDVVGQADATDLGDGELNRQGTTLALIRSYGAGAHLSWYAVGAGAATAKPPAVPAPQCATSAQEGIVGPTWAPDGKRLAFAAPDGIWALQATADCAAGAPALLIPGASQPDWGPAPVNPGPRETGGGTGVPAGGAAPSLAVKRAGARRIARKGLRVTVACPAACTVKAELLVDRKAARRIGLRRGRTAATARRVLPAGGSARLAVRPARRLRKRFARLHGAKLTVRVTVTDAAGGKQVLRRRV